ncbi:caspase, EACC1-associated type [Nocardia niigatensis]|uniref:caspase, EACC1-associated type n=1 Tax=Nocardia niigatensis TaxID=209249 RepID=UPI000305AB26|nr:caspase family protein [Nocardia niigatensis]
MTLPDPEATRAVLIGTANYHSDSGFESFPEIAASLADFAEFLRTATGIPERHIEVVLDPSDGPAMAARVTAAAQAATGLLIVYYVGHGAVVDNQLHLTHTGSRADEADVTALAYAILRARIKKEARGPVVVILDCCHSGKAFGRDVLAADGDALSAATDIDGAFVLTATDEKSKFALAKGEGGRTAFTAMMLDILRTGMPTNDRYLTMSVLYRELRDRLPAASLPKPKALERGTAGRVALAVNPLWSGRTESPGLPPAVATAYTAQIRDLAPSDGLLDRDTELAELADFCHGNEPYVWWQAGPWAGKTALMTWFALHPPPKVRVVSFFITSRLAAQDDHNAFTDAVLEQLSALLPDQAAAVASGTVNRDAQRRHLLALAAQRADESGERIVLLVDGLDEDRGNPSIASLLPKRPRPALRVLVSGRPNPALPLDVPASHPLHHCRRREVGRSRAAFDTIQAARLELRGILYSDNDREILGLITAAHGLTGAELEDLTGLPPFRIERILSGVTGRTFRAQFSRFAPGQINLLAHETLQQEAETALGRALLDEYRDRIHAWAANYRNQGWPSGTPPYLLTRYFSMLRAQGDTARMTDLALDTARHDRLLLLTGSDQIARTEIDTVSGVWLAQRDPDLLAVSELAMRRHRLTQRGRDIPVELPAALARMGELDRARSLADGMLQPSRRLRARIGVVCTQLLPGESHRNLALIDSLRESDTPALSDPHLAHLTEALIAAADIEGAERLADEITTPRERVRVLAQLISVWRPVGRRAAVEAAMTEIGRHVQSAGPAHRVEVYQHAVRAYAAIGDLDRANELGAAAGVELRVTALCAIARSLVSQGNSESASGYVRSALSAAQEIVGLVTRSQLLASIAADLVAAGFGDDLRAQVDDVEAGIAGYSRLAAHSAVVHLVECLVTLGEPDRILALGRRFVRGTDALTVSTSALTAFLAADRPADARRLAAEIELRAYQRVDPRERDLALYHVVRALAIAGETLRAGTVADLITGAEHRFLAFAYLGTRSSETAARASVFLNRSVTAVHAMLARPSNGEMSVIGNFAPTVFATDWLGDDHVSDSHTPVAELVRSLLVRGAYGSARELADRVTALYAASIRPLDGLARGLGGLAAVFVETGHADDARLLIDRIAGLPGRLVVLRTIVEEVGVDLAAPIVAPLLDDGGRTVAVGAALGTLPNRVNRALLAAALGDARGVARLSDDPGRLELGDQRVMSALATARARAGAVGEAVAIAAGLTDDFARSVAYREVVAAQVRAGRELSALDYCDRIPLAGERIGALAQVVPALAANIGAERARTTLSAAIDLLERIPRADVRDRAVAPLVDAALAIGAVGDALELARTTATGVRVRLLARIADALVRTYGDLPPAEQGSARRRIRRVLAEVWSLAAWYSVLDTVARFDPVLLVGIADEAMRLDWQERRANQMNAI